MTQRQITIVAIFLYFLLAFLLYKFSMLLVIVALSLLGLGILTLFHPEIATLAIIFVFYTNLAVVAHKVHGVPEFVAASASLLLMVPIAIYIIRGNRVIIDRPFLLMLVFLTVLLTSANFGRDYHSSLDLFIIDYLIEGVALYFSIVNVIRNVPTLRRAIWTLMIAGIVMGGASLYQEATHSYDSKMLGLTQTKSAGMATGEVTLSGQKIKRHRLAGPVGSKNRYAQIMVVLIPLALYRFWGESSRLLRMVAAVACMLILCGTLLTFSRGAGLSIVLVMMVMTVLGKIRPHHALATLLGLTLVASIAVPQYIPRLLTLKRLEGFVSQEKNIKPSSSMRSRATENLAALNVFLDHPVLGVGPGQGKFYSTEYGNRVGITTLEGTRMAHNMYFQILAEVGVIGFASFMAIVLWILYQLWQLQARWLHKRQELSNLAAAFFFSILTYLISAIFLHLSYQRYYWFLLAIAGAAVTILKAESVLEDGQEEETEQLPSVIPNVAYPHR